MVWDELCFLHWPVPAAPLRERLPPGVELDLFDGEAWVGVVPFLMRGTRFRWMPPVPGAATFPELNLRTYVTVGGRPGVWFFSLDAASRLAVLGARWTFALPYFNARMSMETGADGAVRYGSERTHSGAPQATFRGRYAPRGEATLARAGSLEHFLTERYSLFARRGFGVARSLRGGLVRGDIRHDPWPLQEADVELEVNDMFRLAGLDLDPDRRLAPPLAHFARTLDVEAHAPLRCP